MIFLIVRRHASLALFTAGIGQFARTRGPMRVVPLRVAENSREPVEDGARVDFGPVLVVRRRRRPPASVLVQCACQRVCYCLRRFLFHHDAQITSCYRAADDTVCERNDRLEPPHVIWCHAAHAVALLMLVQRQADVAGTYILAELAFTEDSIVQRMIRGTHVDVVIDPLLPEGTRDDI